MLYLVVALNNVSVLTPVAVDGGVGGGVAIDSGVATGVAINCVVGDGDGVVCCVCCCWRVLL